MWKLLYIYMLGYEVDFGHMQILGLISSQKYAEKQVGYTVTAVLLNETHEFLRLVINSVRDDVIGRNETNQCLGLALVANVGGREFADSMAADVQRLLVSSTVRPIVRKKAALALLRLYRRNKEILVPETWAQKMINLLDERDLGVLSGAISLLTGIVAHDYRGYEACIPKVCALMQRLARNKDIPQDYLYYQLPSPWLQVKCMRVLQYFPTPEDPEYLRAETDVIHQILSGTNMVKNVNKNNALHAVLFEAVSLATMLDTPNKSLLSESVATLGNFIKMKEPNIVYLGLEHMTKMAGPDTLEAIRQYQSIVVAKLHDADISIRKRALDLLYTMCDERNAKEIVASLLQYLVTADFNIREELALKTAILAERYMGGNKRWFLDVALTLVEKAGDFISDKLWHRVVQVVTNAKELHEPAARSALQKLRDGASHEMFVKTAAYFLGEFGHALGPSDPPLGYASLLLELYKTASNGTRAIVLSALAKIAMRAGGDDGLRQKLGQLFHANAGAPEVELQQRSSEYFVMTNVGGNPARLREVMNPMPDFPERASALEKTVADNVGESADAAAAKKVRSAGGVVSAPPSAVADSTREGLGVGAAIPAHELTPSVSSVPTMGLEDLLGGTPPPPASTTAAAVPAGFTVNQGLEDLLGGAMSAAAPPSAAPVAIAPIVNVEECLKKLQAADNGVLYEDAYLQIGVKSRWKENQGQVMLYLGNKQAVGGPDLTGVVMELAPVQGLNVRLGPVPPTIPAKKQEQVLLELAAASGFGDAPSLHLKYTIAGVGSVDRRLQLPYGPHKFCQPWSVTSPQEFFEKWHAVTKCAQDVKVITAAPTVAAGGLPALEAALRGCRLGVQSGIDPNTKNVVAGSKIGYSVQGQTHVLVRCESDANNKSVFRITVAANDAKTVKGVQAALFSQICP